jgi:hypothetical protein
MASEERKGGPGDLGRELDEGDRADVGTKSGQSPIQIMLGQDSFSPAAGQRGCNLDL